ncbi:tail sheath [Yersinia phage fHe-Yen9-02]|nr:tail sheath [Yersinia phage fHe-Yen9-02]
MVQAIADVDQWGIDPLTESVYQDVDSSTYQERTISVALEGNPQRISFDAYGTNAYWRHILIANSLAHSSELVAGMKIRIPIKRPQPKNKKLVRTTI